MPDIRKDLLRRFVDVDYLHPRFVELLVKMLEACQAAGADYYVVSAYRSATEQQKLYDQGRTKPGPIVTNARPFSSAHNFGLAVDFARDLKRKTAGLQPGYNPLLYVELGKQAKRAGLVWGGDFKLKDYPHVQMPRFVTSKDLLPLKQVLDVTPEAPGGTAKERELFKLRAVWQRVDVLSRGR